jgi:hypothetical protein
LYAKRFRPAFLQAPPDLSAREFLPLLPFPELKLTLRPVLIVCQISRSFGVPATAPVPLPGHLFFAQVCRLYYISHCSVKPQKLIFGKFNTTGNKKVPPGTFYRQPAADANLLCATAKTPIWGLRGPKSDGSLSGKNRLSADF